MKPQATDYTERKPIVTDYLLVLSVGIRSDPRQPVLSGDPQDRS